METMSPGPQPFLQEGLALVRTESLRPCATSSPWPMPSYQASLIPTAPFRWQTFLGHLPCARHLVSAATELPVGWEGQTYRDDTGDNVVSARMRGRQEGGGLQGKGVQATSEVKVSWRRYGVGDQPPA